VREREGGAGGEEDQGKARERKSKRVKVRESEK